MKAFLRRLDAKSMLVALLVTGVILLCPANQASSSAATSYNTSPMPASNHSAAANDMDAHPSKTHSEIENHTAGLLTALNDLAALFFVAAFFLALTRQSLFLCIKPYLTKLNHCRHRYRNFIKPKLEEIFLRWLSLLGNTIAYSF